MDPVREADRDALLGAIDDWYEGRLNELEADHLKELLRTEPLARQVYVEYADMRASLAIDSFGRDEPGFGSQVLRNHLERRNPQSELIPLENRNAGMEVGTERGLQKRLAQKGWFRRWVGLACAVSLLSLVAIVVWRLPAPPEMPADRQVADKRPQDASSGILQPSEPIPDGELVPDVELVFGMEQNDAPLLAGGPPVEMVGKSFELAAGFVELYFRSAEASLVIEAPAKFLVQDAKTLRLDYGRVSALVRDGSAGLRVLTPDADVLDLGTRFAVEATKDRHSEVHVFEGQVEAGALQLNARRLLGANEALRFNAGSQPEACDLRRAAFVQPEELAYLATAMQAGGAGQACGAFEKVRNDPALLLALDFEDPDESDVVEVHGPRPVQGRFAGTTAMDFVETGDRIRLNWSPTARKLTMMTWVRLNSLSNDLSSLYLTDKWGTLGQVHWQIRAPEPYAGRMTFDIDGGVPREENPVIGGRRSTAISTLSRSPLFDRLNQWTHLAVTYNADTGSVKLFMNGHLDGTREIPDSMPAVLGPAEIGNWNKLFPRFGDRRLSGRVDEMLILSRDFSPEEIREYYQESSPYR